MTGSESFLVEFGAVCSSDSADVSREFNRRHLHAETKTEKRNIVLARETRGIDLSFSPTNTESPWNQDAGHVFQLVMRRIRDGFSIDKF